MIKNGEEITTNISYRLQFIDSARFISSSFLNFVNNLSAGIHKIKVNRDTMINVKITQLNINININIVTAFLNTQTLKMI